MAGFLLQFIQLIVNVGLVQTNDKDSHRNRLQPKTVDNLLTTQFKDGDYQNFDFTAALDHWRNTKAKGIFLCNSTV